MKKSIYIIMINLFKSSIKNQVKIIILLSLFILVSCSDKSASNKINSSNEAISDEISFEALSLRTSLINGINSIPQSSLDFASLQADGVFDQLFSDNLDVVFGIKSATSSFNIAGTNKNPIVYDGQNLFIGMSSSTTFKGIGFNRIIVLNSDGTLEE